MAFATLQREERPDFALLAAAVKRLQFAAAQIDELLRKPASLLDPGAHPGRIGIDDDAGRLWGARTFTGTPIDDARCVEAEHGALGDADAVRRDRAQHERAGREARPVDDDLLARSARAGTAASTASKTAKMTLIMGYLPRPRTRASNEAVG